MLDNLNPQQKEAVIYCNAPSLILAGAGSGKTRVLTTKVLHLIEKHNVNPLNIAMVTFTNKAAKEMQERVSITLGFIGTFHSLCARILRRDAPHIGLGHDFVIYDDGDTDVIIKHIMKDMIMKKKLTPSYVKYRISSAKDNLLSPEKYASFARSEQDEILAKIYTAYQKKLSDNNPI